MDNSEGTSDHIHTSTLNTAGRRSSIWGMFCVWLLLIPLLVGAPDPVLANENHAAEKLVILSQNLRLKFSVEVVSDYQDRKTGLMFRRSLAPRAGMLFDYGVARQVAMWMRNTYLPLDILFIDSSGVIRNIATDTVPLSLTPIPSDGPVLGVLELNAGTTRALQIKPGDIVLNRIFGNMTP